MSTPQFYSLFPSPTNGPPYWRLYHDRLVLVCENVWLGVRAMLCIDSPEGQDEDAADELKGPKDLLSCSWRALRESRYYLHRYQIGKMVLIQTKQHASPRHITQFDLRPRLPQHWTCRSRFQQNGNTKFYAACGATTPWCIFCSFSDFHGLLPKMRTGNGPGHFQPFKCLVQGICLLYLSLFRKTTLTVVGCFENHRPAGVEAHSKIRRPPCAGHRDSLISAGWSSFPSNHA